MAIERDMVINAFPTSLTQDISLFLDKLNWTSENKSSACFQVIYEGELLNIPYRIYHDEPNQQNLTLLEAFLLNCLFTRHHNGYVRERHLKAILTSESYLTTPFIVQLLGEYVLEILILIKYNITPMLLDNLIKFEAANKTFFYKTEQRLGSYWNCYYKHQFPKKADYPGFEILKAIKNRKRELDMIM